MPVFNNLSELGKFQLSQSPSSTMKFNLPVLKLSNTDASSSLSEFANLQLKNYQKKSPVDQKFAIPNIFASKPLNTVQTQTIDLKSALLTDHEKKEMPKEEKAHKEKSNEKFIPQFIDCVEVFTPKLLSHNCENTVISTTTLHDLLREKTRLNHPSMVGKIIGKRFQKKVPYIRHSYAALQDINRFKFDIPSPDDQILAHLKKKKQPNC